jgi:hypothetical protein
MDQYCINIGGEEVEEEGGRERGREEEGRGRGGGRVVRIKQHRFLRDEFGVCVTSIHPYTAPKAKFKL